MWTTAERKQEQQYYLEPHSHDNHRTESVFNVPVSSVASSLGLY